MILSFARILDKNLPFKKQSYIHTVINKKLEYWSNGVME